MFAHIHSLAELKSFLIEIVSEKFNDLIKDFLFVIIKIEQ